jgi:2-iminobutanoate/2-iminopropanoate deaminase
MIERLSPPGVPAPRGPYSPAVKAGGFVYVSGQVAVDTSTNQLSLGDVQHETRLILHNTKAILAGAGATLAQVIKCTVYLSNGADFAPMNEVYAEFFGEHKPARSTVVCSFAIAGIKVEIDCIAYVAD